MKFKPYSENLFLKEYTFGKYTFTKYKVVFPFWLQQWKEIRGIVQSWLQLFKSMTVQQDYIRFSKVIFGSARLYSVQQGYIRFGEVIFGSARLSLTWLGDRDTCVSKEWNEHILMYISMYIYHQQCETIRQIGWICSNGQFEWLYKAMSRIQCWKQFFRTNTLFESNGSQLSKYIVQGGVSWSYMPSERSGTDSYFHSDTVSYANATKRLPGWLEFFFYF